MSLPESTPKMLQRHHRSLAEPRTPRELAPEKRRAGTSGLWPWSWAKAFLPHLSCCLCREGEAVGRKVRKRKPWDTQLHPSLMTIIGVPCIQVEDEEDRYGSLWFSSY